MSGAIPYFGDAYMADTRHLTLEEHGAYHLLLLIAWRSPHCSLPDDDRRIAQMLGITSKKWGSLKPTVMAFWTRNEHGWEQKRLTKERRWVEEKSRKNSAAAEAKWEAKRLENKELGDANASANAHADADANGDAPLPPPAEEKSSVANATGGNPPPDPAKTMFDLGVSILTEAGQTEKQARSLIGKWRKEKGDEAAIIAGLIDCRSKAISNPVEWLTKRFGSSAYVSASGYEYRGDLKTVKREAEKRADWGTYWRVDSELKSQARA